MIAANIVSTARWAAVILWPSAIVVSSRSSGKDFCAGSPTIPSTAVADLQTTTSRSSYG